MIAKDDRSFKSLSYTEKSLSLQKVSFSRGKISGNSKRHQFEFRGAERAATAEVLVRKTMI